MIELASRNLSLDAGWEVASCAADQWQSPGDVARDLPLMHAAVVPGTVVQVPGLVTALEGRRLDALDHWYRLHFRAEGSTCLRRELCFDGLATLADVWLDGQSLLSSENMFVSHRCDVTAQLAHGGEHELWIRFRALLPVLQVRRPRGRWPTRLVSQKHLRFVRTSLLGYMPGWYPELPPVGPWRAVRLVEHDSFMITSKRLRTRLDGDCGVVSFRGEVEAVANNMPNRACLRLGSGAEAELSVERVSPTQLRISGELRVPNVQRWWPHTHGEPALHSVSLELKADAQIHTHSLGRIGFRTVVVDRGEDGAGFALRINDHDVFCRGACWSPLDVSSVHATPERYREALEQVRAAGFNMLRISGVMAYESDTFYDLCDQLGVLVWQDFMFANMDYPVGEAAFMHSCAEEAAQLCERLGARPCLTVLCGGSEVMQQAVMMGVPASELQSPLFDELLPNVCRDGDVNVPYVPSSPSGGALPFHVNEGVGHYYGVGAYLRPLDDVRVANVRFAAECLAFSNPPERSTSLPAPRDPGATWDFADVTDHYVKLLFGVDSRALRESDPGRHVDLSRIAVGEAMSAVMGHLRRSDSKARGALVWMLRDPHYAPGWGLIDAEGVPKSAYYFLKRACAPRALWFSDEGVNGLLLYADNETERAWRGRLSVSLHRDDGRRVEHAENDVELAAGTQASWNVERLIGHFVDASYAYRFGPPGHRLVSASWIESGDAYPSARAFHDVQPGQISSPSEVQMRLDMATDGSGELLIECPTVCGHVAIDMPGAILSDNYFRLVPGIAHRVQLGSRAASATAVIGRARVVGGEPLGELWIRPRDGAEGL